MAVQRISSNDSEASSILRLTQFPGLPSTGFTIGNPTARSPNIVTRPLEQLDVNIELQSTGDGKVSLGQSIKEFEYRCIKSVTFDADPPLQRRVEKAIAVNEPLGIDTRPDTETVLNSFVAFMAAVIAAITTQDAVNDPLWHLDRAVGGIRKLLGFPPGNRFQEVETTAKNQRAVSRLGRDLESIAARRLDRMLVIGILACLMASYGAPNGVYLVQEVRLRRWEEKTGFFSVEGEGTLRVSAGFPSLNVTQTDLDFFEVELELITPEAMTVTRTATEDNVGWMATFFFIYVFTAAGLILKRYYRMVLGNPEERGGAEAADIGLKEST